MQEEDVLSERRTRSKVSELEMKVFKMTEKHAYGQEVDSSLEHACLAECYGKQCKYNVLVISIATTTGCFKNNRQVRWHPVMIRWCLHLKSMSTSTYDAMSTRTLPCNRTLRDYTHWMEAGPGYIDKIDQHLMIKTKISSLPEFQNFVCLLFELRKIWFMTRILQRS